MPCSVSVSAAVLSVLGANQRLPYHWRMRSGSCPSLIWNGRMLCGVMASLRSSCATMAGEPQGIAALGCRHFKTRVNRSFTCAYRFGRTAGRVAQGFSQILLLRRGPALRAWLRSRARWCRNCGRLSAWALASIPGLPPHSEQGCLRTMVGRAAGVAGAWLEEVGAVWSVTAQNIRCTAQALAAGTLARAPRTGRLARFPFSGQHWVIGTRPSRWGVDLPAQELIECRLANPPLAADLARFQVTGLDFGRPARQAHHLVRPGPGEDLQRPLVRVQPGCAPPVQLQVKGSARRRLAGSPAIALRRLACFSSSPAPYQAPGHGGGQGGCRCRLLWFATAWPSVNFT